jgi:hypothetical protein
MRGEDGLSYWQTPGVFWQLNGLIVFDLKANGAGEPRGSKL